MSSISHPLNFSSAQPIRDFRAHRVCAGREGGDQFAFFIEQEFAEVPGNGIVHSFFLSLVFQVFVQGVCIVPLHGNFLGHGKAHAIILLAECLDLGVAAGFLSHEIISRKPHDHQLVRVLFIEFFQFLVLGRQAAAGGGVYDQDLLAFELFESDRIAIQSGYFKIIDRAAEQQGG